MSNHLKQENSPYLLQHTENPVDWYPWGEEAFKKARQEDKPIFLSIGYSTCHWCHVMAHECFENTKIASILNQYFISIKVDREERPDIDSVYMSVCQALTGSGGWPLSIFMTVEQKPFFAGTYYPPVSRSGMIGFPDLLLAIADRWKHHRAELTTSAEDILTYIHAQNNQINRTFQEHTPNEEQLVSNYDQLSKSEELLLSNCSNLLKLAADSFSQSFDSKYGGFGEAPKFPIPHNIIFLIFYSKLYQDPAAWKQADITLEKMRRGGIFDQIGYGFSRYSTDRYYLVPHFEKMLYDNALLMLAYSTAYKASGNPVFLDTAKQTADYIFREMTGKHGEFYSAQDADSEGQEGKFYTWDYKEICEILGDTTGSQFCNYFGITKQGNFEGTNIPNLLNGNKIATIFEQEINTLYLHRKSRFALHLDDKILTSWNSLMIAAMSILYRITGSKRYLLAAESASHYIEEHLANKLLLYVSYRESETNPCSDSKNSFDTKNSFDAENSSHTKNSFDIKNSSDPKNFDRENIHSVKGFLEDYAYYTAALIGLYQATSFPAYLTRAEQICQEAQRQFEDKEADGYFLYGSENSTLITRPKESYDGALPSGNSVMAYCLVRLFHLTGKEYYKTAAERQLTFLSKEAAHYPAGYSMFLIAFLLYSNPPEKITVVLSKEDSAETIFPELPLYADITILPQSTDKYKLLNNQTTYYRCRNHTCLPPTNEKIFENPAF